LAFFGIAEDVAEARAGEVSSKAVRNLRAAKGEELHEGSLVAVVTTLDISEVAHTGFVQQEHRVSILLGWWPNRACFAVREDGIAAGLGDVHEKCVAGRWRLANVVLDLEESVEGGFADSNWLSVSFWISCVVRDVHSSTFEIKVHVQGLF
jgi:hypothetical protein